jgi:hypothetical protein
VHPLQDADSNRELSVWAYETWKSGSPVWLAGPRLERTRAQENKMANIGEGCLRME